MLSIKKENLRINPVLLKELKVKMRSWKAAILIGVYNLVLTLLTIFITKISMDEHTMIVDTSVILGIYTFMRWCLIDNINITSLTAGAIAGKGEA